MSQVMILPYAGTKNVSSTEVVPIDLVPLTSQKPGRRAVEQVSHISQRNAQEPMDESLVERAVAGDDRAFEQLVDRYYAVIFNFVRRILEEKEDTEDIVQFAFLQLYTSLPRLRGNLVSTRTREPLKAWLFQVARNRCLDERRKKHPFRFSDLTAYNSEEEEVSLIERLLDPAPLPEEFAERQEEQRNLQDAIQSLPARFRSVVSLRYQEELSFGEIGRRLHMPENTAKTYFQRARPLLRTALTSQ